MKKFLKISFLLIISISFIAFLSKQKILNFQLLSNAFKEHKFFILGIGIAQIINHISMSLRYKHILKVLGLEKKTRNVISSTFISTAIGQWLPGSLAFTEVIRIGLMIKRRKGDKLTPIEKFHLTTASLLDRIIGFFVALFLSTILVFYFMLKTPDKSSIHFYILFALFMVNLLLCGLLLLLPIIAESQPMQRILARCERICLRFVSHSIAQDTIVNVFHKLNSMIKVFGENGKQYKLFWKSAIYSLGSIASFTLGLHFAWRALNGTLPILETVALNSSMALSIAAPISVGGIGAPQLIAAILYQAVGADATIAASAQLLLVGVTLVTISICGLIYLPRMIKEIIKPKIA